MQFGRPGFGPWAGKIPWRRERLPTPVFQPGEFCGLYSPWSCKESDRTQQLSLSLFKLGIIIFNLIYLFQLEACPAHASLVAQLVKNPPAMQETLVRSLGWEDPLEKGTATHSSIVAWRIPWTEEPGRL